MKHLHLKILILTLLCGLTASAQVKLQVASKVNEGSKFQVTVIVNDDQASAPPSITIPNCRFIIRGITSSVATTIINGNAEVVKRVQYTYTMYAERAGTVTIPSIPVTLSGGKTAKTEPRTLEILGANQRSSSVDRTSPNYDDIPDGSRVNPESHISANDMFVRIVIDKSTVYEQEPVIATIKLYSRLNMSAKFQMLTQPTFEGFLSEELDVNMPQSSETIDGKSYNSYIVKRCVLYPQKAGTLKVTSGTYEITLEDIVTVNSGIFMPDHRIVTKTIQTPDKSATLKVLPLPEPRPASFDGAVGQYDATVDLSPMALNTNDPATYTIRITGKGNIKYLKTPNLDVPDGIDKYTPKTDINAQYANGDISGTYTATYTLVPQEVGDFDIPPVDFTYFNPRTKEYKTINLRGFHLKVGKGAVVADTKKETKAMTDILHIHLASKPLSKNIGYVYHQWWYWALYLVLTMALVAAVLLYRRQIKLNADVRGRRLARAMREAMKRFKSARSMMSEHQADNFYAEINKALNGYLCDKLGIPASQLVRENISSSLAQYGLDPNAITEVIGILDECEMARFTPMHSDADMQQLYDKVLDAVKSIENVKK